MKYKYYIYIFLFFLITLTFIFRNKIENAGINYLSPTKRADANVLLIEGWLPDYALDSAMKEYNAHDYDYVVTTGMKLPEHFGMFVRGFLIFDLSGQHLPQSTEEITIVNVIAKSSVEKQNGAEFELWINDEVVADFTAGIEDEVFTYQWKGKAEQIDSVLIHFNNDGFVDGVDRNLFIKEIRINNETLRPYSANVYSDLKELDNNDRSENLYSSYAEMAARNLMNKGVDPAKLFSVSGGNDKKYKTLQTAREFNLWLSEKHIDVKGINIVSLGAHSRRTWKTYKKVLRSADIPVGIVSVTPYYTMSSQFNKKTFNLLQLAAYIIYSVYLLFVF